MCGFGINDDESIQRYWLKINKKPQFILVNHYDLLTKEALRQNKKVFV